MPQPTDLSLAPYLYRDRRKTSGVVVSGVNLRPGTRIFVHMPLFRDEGKVCLWSGYLNNRGIQNITPSMNGGPADLQIYMVGVRFVGVGLITSKKGDRLQFDLDVELTEGIEMAAQTMEFDAKMPPGAEGGDITVVAEDPAGDTGSGSQSGGGNEPDPNNP